MDKETMPKFGGGAETGSFNRGRNGVYNNRWTPRRGGGGRGSYNNRGSRNNFDRREFYGQTEKSNTRRREEEDAATGEENNKEDDKCRYNSFDSRPQNERVQKTQGYVDKGRKDKNGRMSVYAKEFVPCSARPNFSNFACASGVNEWQPFVTLPERVGVNECMTNESYLDDNKPKHLNGNRLHKKSSSNENNSRTYVYNKKSKENFNSINEEEISHRDRLIQQLAQNKCECSVCCDRVRGQDAVWSCSNCYNIFHLKCIRKWAKSPSAIVEGAGWRCPVCQHIRDKIPTQYSCFCGKMRDPPWNHYITPHSCGELCGRQRKQNNCNHRCNILCHPGPCPPCQLQVKRQCECGKTTQTVRCGQSDPTICSNICDKKLNCGLHLCTKICHTGPCPTCDQQIEQKCYCGKESKRVLCTQETANQKFFSCKKICDRLLDCGNHTCNSICHEGPCETCQLTPELVSWCPCGKTLLSDLKGSNRRVSCMDLIPTCQQVCDKVLTCGPQDNHHRCSAICHLKDCPPCPLTTQIKCRCSSKTKDIPCAELASKKEFLCEKKCNKKRQCGRHKCIQKCCVDPTHVCSLVCNRKLSCGLHTCQDQCHRGNCAPCWHTSFDELTCHCGSSVLYPPIACGTKPPECNQPCSRLHACAHPVTHSCHNDQVCPPCTFLTEKWCYGKHELRSNVPCYLEDISCGRPCCKLLPCKQHKCPLICHPGVCLKPGTPCKLPCTKLRAVCSHPCGVPCHGDRPCPDTPCKATVVVTCQCGHLTETITCAENQRALRQMAATSMAVKMNAVSQGETVDISELVKTNNKTKRLECNEDCALIDRNRRLALALQIRNPELTNKLGPPSYTDFLKEQMKNNARFVTQVYNKLTEVVQNAKQSKQKSRSFAFPPMNRDQRRVIHELAEYFGCETQSYDEEPKKNVVITALRDKSWLPSVSLMTVIDRESIHRKAPPPIPHNRPQLSNSKTDVAIAETPTTSNESKNVIDYFDYVPQS